MILRWFIRLFRTQPMCPLWINVKWADLPPHKQWPQRIENAWTVPRNVRGRRMISAFIGTRDWLWTGPRTITAYANLERGMK